jgi:transcriptional regulator with XRE-family HTH domain
MRTSAGWLRDSQVTVPPLRAVRIAKGKSLRETAEAAGITSAHLSLVERGKRQTSVEVLGRLAEVLDLHELAKLLAPYRETR